MLGKNKERKRMEAPGGRIRGGGGKWADQGRCRGGMSVWRFETQRQSMHCH